VTLAREFEALVQEATAHWLVFEPFGFRALAAALVARKIQTQTRSPAPPVRSMVQIEMDFRLTYLNGSRKKNIAAQVVAAMVFDGMIGS